MKQLCLLLVPCLLWLAGCSTQDQRAEVKAAFADYKTAILTDDGAKAYQLVDKRTRDWYQTSLTRALTFDREQIMQLGVMDKLQILIIRHRIDAGRLRTMSAEDLFIYAVDNGWVGKNSVSGLELDEVNITDDFATGVAIVGGKKSSLHFHFYREDGSWRMDLTELNKHAGTAFRAQIADSGLSEIDYLLEITRMISGRPVAENIWDPLTGADERQ